MKDDPRPSLTVTPQPDVCSPENRVCGLYDKEHNACCLEASPYPNNHWECSREKWHSGPHIACEGSMPHWRHNVATWPQEPAQEPQGSGDAEAWAAPAKAKDALLAILSNPVAVYLNMMHGKIAIPSVSQLQELIHKQGGDEPCAPPLTPMENASAADTLNKIPSATASPAEGASNAAPKSDPSGAADSSLSEIVLAEVFPRGKGSLMISATTKGIKVGGITVPWPWLDKYRTIYTPHPVPDAGASETPERYDLVDTRACGESWREMEKATEGEWVRWEDIERRLLASQQREAEKDAEIARLSEEAVEDERSISDFAKHVLEREEERDAARAEVERLKGELEKERANFGREHLVASLNRLDTAGMGKTGKPNTLRAMVEEIAEALATTQALTRTQAERIAELEVDGRRLDWLEAHGIAAWQTGQQWSEKYGIHGPTLRAAIDAATASTKEEA